MLIKVKARSRISFEKLVEWLHGNTRLKHFHAVEPTVYLNHHPHMNTDRASPKADDCAHPWLAADHSVNSFMSSLGELSSHGVPDMPPAREKRQPVDLMPYRADKPPAVQPPNAVHGFASSAIQVDGREIVIQGHISPNKKPAEAGS